MKAELTDELKERFFAQYWGQKVMELPYLVMREVDGFYLQVIARHNKPLHLRPLDQITDKEAIEVAKIGGVRYQLDSSMITHGRLLLSEYINSSRCNVRGCDWMFIVDYLRYIGVAIPFMGISVEDLVSAGWIKLTNPPA